MAKYYVKFCIQDKILSIIFGTFFAVMLYGITKQLYGKIVVINCQPQPQQVICKIFEVDPGESQARAIPKTQLARVGTIEGRTYKNKKTELDVLITTDQREILLGTSYAHNRTERITAFINDSQAQTLIIDPRPTFTIGAVVSNGLVTLILFVIFQAAWIPPRRKRR
jgi:hypothetical protein